jgi:hypothetical protein
MAKVWPVYDGKEPTAGKPWVVLPLDEAIALLDLEREHVLSDLSRPPRFGDADREMRFADYQNVVVEVGGAEARKARWRPGFYRSPVTPGEAFVRLVGHVAKAHLGPEQVVRVAAEPAIDSEGREALRVTIVIRPGAAKQLGGDAVLDTLVGVQERLQEMGEQRVPIIEYATEQELKQGASSQP